MNNYRKPFLIAEIGCNHMGDMDTAKELILLAKNNGADAAKFQKRNNRELVTDEQYNALIQTHKIHTEIHMVHTESFWNSL